MGSTENLPAPPPGHCMTGQRGRCLVTGSPMDDAVNTLGTASRSRVAIEALSAERSSPPGQRPCRARRPPGRARSPLAQPAQPIQALFSSRAHRAAQRAHQAMIITVVETYADTPPSNDTLERRRWQAVYEAQGSDEFPASILASQLTDFSTARWYRGNDPALGVNDVADDDVWSELEVQLLTAEGPRMERIAALQGESARLMLQAVLELANQTVTGFVWISVE
jgi:hypothetical protein